jgi:hypothetical protein
VERDAYGQMGLRFHGRPTVCLDILEGLHALTFWKVCGSGRAFALQFQHIILGMLMTVKNYKSSGYSGVEAGFLLALGELSGGVKHIQALLENADARAARKCSCGR